MILFVN
jgi:hypothetical protein